MTFDAVAGEPQSPHHLGPHRRHGGVDLRLGDAKATHPRIETVELLCPVMQRRVTARTHVGDNIGNGGVDVGGHLALGGQKGGKAALEIGRAVVEANGHGSLQQKIERGRSAEIVRGLMLGSPGSAEIGEARLDAFDIEPHGAAAGELKEDVPRGIVGLPLEANGKKADDGVGEIAADMRPT